MNEHLNTTVQTLKERLNLEVYEFRGQLSLIVPPEHLRKVCQALRDEFGFEQLAALSGVDYWPEMEPRFHIIYQLHSLQHNLRIGLRLPLSGMSPNAPSLVEIYPNANWHEREVWDMFGVRFEGHPDHRRIIMPADWNGHPLRKDYPLGYEEVQFTFNVDEIQVKKPSPKQ